MRASTVLASTLIVAGAAVSAQVQPWTECMTTCMEQSYESAGCTAEYEQVDCLCLNAQFTTLTRTCFYTACVDDIYPWYNFREAECGSLTRDLDSPQFVPSNGNSTYDLANGNSTEGTNGTSSTAGSASAPVSPSGSATSAPVSATSSAAPASTTPPAASSAGASTGASGSAAAAASPTGAAGRTMAVDAPMAVLIAGLAFAGSYMTL